MLLVCEDRERFCVFVGTCFEKISCLFVKAPAELRHSIKLVGGWKKNDFWHSLVCVKFTSQLFYD